MPSTTNLTTNSRSMNGLNIIDANSINTDNLDVDNLTINLSGTCPNITPYTTNNNKIANTNFVQNALTSGLSGYAKLANSQTFTGYNTFNGGIEINDFNLLVNDTCDIELYGNLYVQNGVIYYSITPQQISFLSGVSSNIQTQLNNRALLNAFNQFIYAKGQSNSPNMQLTDSTGNKSIVFNTNANTNYMSPFVNAGECVISGLSGTIDTQTITLTTNSSTVIGLKITPTLCRLRAGGNWLLVDSSSASSCTGNFTFNGKVGYNGTNIQYGDLTSFQSVTTASQNVLYGSSIGQNVTSAQQNLICGYNSGNSLSDGTQNVVIGVNSASSLNHGSYNILISGGAGARLGSGAGEQSNCIIGYNSLITHTGSNNVCIGRSVMRGNAGATTYDAQNNTVIGVSAFFNAQTCSNNTSIGVNSGYGNTTGNNNCFFGINAGSSNVSNNYLSCLGAYSGDSSILASNRMIFGSSSGNEDYIFAGIPTLNSRNLTTDVNLFTTSTGNINIGGSSGTLTSNKIISCSISPTIGTHLCNKTYVDTTASTAILASNNTFTGTNQFNNNIIVKDTTGTTEFFEVKQANNNIAPQNTIARTQFTGGSYQTVHSFTNSAGYIGRIILSLPIGIYCSGTGSGGSSTTFTTTLSSVPYQILKNGSTYVSPTAPYFIGGTCPDTKSLLYSSPTGSFACEIFICEISIAFEITSGATDFYAIQLNYSGSCSLPSAINQYVCAGTVSTFQAITGPITMTSSTNSGYIAKQLYSSPLYNSSTTMNNLNNGYCALPRVINSNPCGTIIQSLARTAPFGYLLADGSTVNISDYPDLFGLIQYDYGYGTYGVSFKLPNLNGAFLRGAGSQVYSGITYETTIGEFQQDCTLPIKGQGFYNYSTGSGRQSSSRYKNTADPIDTSVPYYTDREGIEVRPFNFGVYYYIKY